MSAQFPTTSARLEVRSTGFPRVENSTHHHDDDDDNDHTDTVSGIHALCDRISGTINGCNLDITGINVLMRAIQSARAIPTRKVIIFAVTGNQGIGKSSLLIPLLGEPVVNVSAGDSAEIVWKEGAADSTMQSDMIVEFQDEERNRESGRQHLRDFVASKCPSGIMPIQATPNVALW